jgi:hypothetical protein
MVVVTKVVPSIHINGELSFEVGPVGTRKALEILPGD